MDAQPKEEPILTKEAKATIQEIARATGLGIEKVTLMLLPYYSKKPPSKRAIQSAEWRAANREKERARREAWRAKNKDKIRASRKAWRKANREKHRASQRAWEASERQKALDDPAYHAKQKEKARAYRAANKDKVKAWQTAWRKKNREKMNAKRRAPKS